MGMEYSAGRMKQRNARRKKTTQAIPYAGDVTVTRADGSMEVQSAIRKGVDRRTVQPWTSSQVKKMTHQQIGTHSGSG